MRKKLSQPNKRLYCSGKQEFCNEILKQNPEEERTTDDNYNLLKNKIMKNHNQYI